MNVILWIIFGGIAGWIASLVTGNDAQMGILWNVIVGIAGAFIGGWVADRMGVGGTPGVERPGASIMSFVTAVVGAIVLLVILNFVI